MGGMFTKDYFEKLLNNSEYSTQNSARQEQPNEEEATPNKDLPGDPRSPTAGIVRTPLVFHSSVLDPRSPTMGITRTPLHGEPVEVVHDDEEPVVCLEKLLSDPRSPSSGFDRTPILADCEVHHNWENLNDSMVVNASSIQLDPLDLEDFVEEGTDCGSLENLYTDSQEELSPISDNTSDIEKVSSINSSSKEQTSVFEKETVSQLTNPISTSTPQKNHRKLTIRDQNSPLSIVQRKQSAKVEKCLNGKSKAPMSFTVAQDKENVA